MSVSYTMNISLMVQQCYKCGINFGIPTDWDQCRRDDHKSFYCPAGHSQCYTGKTRFDRAQEAQEKAERIAQAERERHERTRKELAHVEAKRRGEKAAKTRLKKRIANGCCPCCKRSFVNLRKHMNGQHPEYVERKGGV